MYTDFEPENQVKQAYTLALRKFMKQNQLFI